MAGHSKFKNIMHRKGAQDKKRAKLFTKLIREITVAVKAGSDDPQKNPRLRIAMLSARSANLPKNKIESAIQKASSTSSTSENYEEIRYEGYGPYGVAFIVETLTDNRNRTASEIRAAFSKAGGSLGESGSVSYLFEKVGIIIYNKSDVADDNILELAIECGAKDYEEQEDCHIIICDSSSFSSVKEELDKVIKSEASQVTLMHRPLSFMDIEEDKIASVKKLYNILEENDDVQNVWVNITLPEEDSE
ncbi:YebC/PmpR family DNA-binding transcriptional regulator [Candidatus Cyrtobacter comes]|uniref:Probable transcriptional regulatory protein Cyrtocomes_01143 n=1 Tax=Candidatus Cyrtobacter comes TaxID=675776 RepID=A0ABU5L9E9_9RICK|nr:YebC/PmpR family DNA-binding transcriptional regulator [Candidatus Cyrtobacter comes]MDZ5762749.1 YebC/PmpR family DNA-binding transcriptional regulator [Candidatus Cyrtobacter comes]